MLLLIIILCCLSITGFSQEPTVKRPEQLIIPSPQDFYQVDSGDYTNVKSILTIRKMKRNDGFRIDTLNRTYYENGLKTKIVNFGLTDGLPDLTTKFTYNDDKTIASWSWQDYNYDLLNIYKYDSAQRIIRIDKYQIIKYWGSRDTIVFKNEVYSYSGDKLIGINIYNYPNSSVSSSEHTIIYKYKDNLLHQNNDYAFLNTYEYDKSNNLSKITSNYQLIKSDTSISIKTFKYNTNHQLVKKT